MTPEAQQIAIVEACGWKRRADLDYKSKEPYADELVHTIWAKDGRTCDQITMPDYLNDLNAAIRFAEEVGRLSKWKSFSLHRSFSYDGAPFYHVCFATSFMSSSPHDYLETVCGSSPEKALCEAGLKALNLWIEEPNKETK